MKSAAQGLDSRRRRTREALLSAFTLLALQRRYHAIRVDDVLAQAGIGRSTFYEHFGNKDALLVASMDPATSLLARTPAGESTAREVAALLAHLWHNRALARSLLHGSALRVVRHALVAQVDELLAARAGGKLALPRRLAAHALADGLLSPILAWLWGKRPAIRTTSPPRWSMRRRRRSPAWSARRADTGQRKRAG